MNAFIAVPGKYVKWIRDEVVVKGATRGVYTYTMPEVEEFLKENQLDGVTTMNLYGQYGVQFSSETDAVMFKLAFL